MRFNTIEPIWREWPTSIHTIHTLNIHSLCVICNSIIYICYVNSLELTMHCFSAVLMLVVITFWCKDVRQLFIHVANLRINREWAYLVGSNRHTFSQLRQFSSQWHVEIFNIFRECEVFIEMERFRLPSFPQFMLLVSEHQTSFGYLINCSGLYTFDAECSQRKEESKFAHKTINNSYEFILIMCVAQKSRTENIAVMEMFGKEHQHQQQNRRG